MSERVETQLEFDGQRASSRAFSGSASHEGTGVIAFFEDPTTL
jgi:hypothetical protein